MLTARGYLFMDDNERARERFESARASIECEIAERPDDTRLHSSMGLVLAELGRKEDAIRAAKRGVEFLPVSKEAERGPMRRVQLADV